MNIESNKYHSRLFYLDYLRLFLVLSVVALHSVMAYAVNTDHVWHVLDSSRNIIFDAYALLFDYSVMPIFFFVAGFFMLKSIQKKKISEFIKKKFFRLIVPFILAIIFVIPFAMYFRSLYHFNQTWGFSEYWFFNYWADFNQLMHLWFLPALFVFFLVYAFIYFLKKDFFISLSEGTLLIFVTITTLIFFIISIFITYDKWIMAGDFYLIQPTRYVIYFAFFSLGIMFYRSDFFSKNKKFSDSFLWIILAIFTFTFIVFIYYFYMENLNELSFVFINSILRVVFCLSALMSLTFLFRKFLNFPSKIIQKMSSNSYAIYIIHYPFVVALQYYLIDLPVSIFIKFFIVFVLSILASFALSEYILRRMPFLKNIL